MPVAPVPDLVPAIPEIWVGASALVLLLYGVFRGTAATRRIPVLILTAKELTPEDRGKLSANNIQELVQKGDVDRAELLRKVKQMMGMASFSSSWRSQWSIISIIWVICLTSFV